MNLPENLHYNLRERILLNNSCKVFGQLFNNNLKILLLELYQSFYLCFQLADAWSVGTGDKSQRYTLLCARIRKWTGGEPNHPLCFKVPWAGTCTKTDQTAWNSIKKCRCRCHVSVHVVWDRCNCFMTLRSWTLMGGQPPFADEAFHQMDFDLL